MAEKAVDEKSPDFHLETLGTEVRSDDPIVLEREAKEKALLRRIDKRMMPLMMLICEFEPQCLSCCSTEIHCRCPELSRSQQHRYGTPRKL